mmetsp:Transcript_39255/g.100605  ORF Transcript_39255/g.100605 Transcript_39255/m.100605 type:complete len:243 (+) Transcript_39255:282-1010(+)
MWRHNIGTEGRRRANNIWMCSSPPSLPKDETHSNKGGTHLELADDKGKTFLETLASLGRATLDLPLPVSNLVKSHGLGEFVSLGGKGKILLVGEDKEGHVGELLFLQKLGKLVTSLIKSSLIGSVDHVDECIGPLEVVSPVRPDAPLSTNIPHVEVETVLLHRLDVETLGGHGVRRVLISKLLQDGGLSGIVETEEKDPSLLLLLLDTSEQLEKTHFFLCVLCFSLVWLLPFFCIVLNPWRS